METELGTCVDKLEHGGGMVGGRGGVGAHDKGEVYRELDQEQRLHIISVQLMHRLQPFGLAIRACFCFFYTTIC